jgi:hypothetical protein
MPRSECCVTGGSASRNTPYSGFTHEAIVIEPAPAIFRIVEPEAEETPGGRRGDR